MSQQPTTSKVPSLRNNPTLRQRFANWRRRAWRWLRNAWHDMWKVLWSLVKWLVSQLALFIKALPLLVLWLIAGTLLFRWIMIYQADLVGGQPAIALLGALITALVGFGVQQWNKLAEEEKTRRDKREETLRVIGDLPLLLKDDPSKGAHLYREYLLKADPAWRDAQVQDYLQRVWKEKALPKLRHTIELWIAFEDNPSQWLATLKHIDVQEAVQSLQWAYGVLGEDWQWRVAEMLRDLGTRPEYRGTLCGKILQEIEQRSWEAILQAWPHVHPWGPFRSPDPPDVAAGVQLLEPRGLRENPFGSDPAETDVLLLKCRVPLTALRLAHYPKPTLIFGITGSGKTASALLLAYDSLRDRFSFPIYYSDIPSLPIRRAQLDGLAKAVSHTLLHFLAINPEDFTKQQGVAHRAAIAHLLGLYVGTGGNLALRLQQVGLSSVGAGSQMLKELEHLMQNTSFDALPDENETIALLGRARPRGFPCTFVLLDLAGEPEDDATAMAMATPLQSLLELTLPLARVGVYLKAFLPEKLRSHLRVGPLQPTPLEWHTEDLQLLLANRLKQVSSVDSLGTLCDPEAKNLPATPDRMLIQAAQQPVVQGPPGRLIQLGNRLLARVATHPEKPAITAKDLDDVLGPLPE